MFSVLLAQVASFQEVVKCRHSHCVPQRRRATLGINTRSLPPRPPLPPPQDKQPDTLHIYNRSLEFCLSQHQVTMKMVQKGKPSGHFLFAGPGGTGAPMPGPTHHRKLEKLWEGQGWRCLGGVVPGRGTPPKEEPLGLPAVRPSSLSCHPCPPASLPHLALPHGPPGVTRARGHLWGFLWATALLGELAPKSLEFHIIFTGH